MHLHVDHSNAKSEVKYLSESFLKDATLLFSVHKEFVFACQLGLDFEDLLDENLVAWLHS